MNKNKLWILPILFLLVLGAVKAADCIYYTVASSTDGGSDYYGVGITGWNSTTVGADVKLTSYTAFTPRINFTAVVREEITGGEVASQSTIHWVMNAGTPFNQSNSSVRLTTGATTIGGANYSLLPVNSSLNTTYYIYWNTVTYNGTKVNVTFNRTFVKAVDDLIVNPAGVNSDTPYTSSWLDTNVSADYGSTAYFRLDNYQAYGAMVADNNWAVTWNYNTRTCASYAIDEATTSGLSNTKSLVFAGLALLAVMILVTVAWGLIQIFKGGAVDFMEVTIVAIGGAVLIMLGYVIIYFVATALGG